MKQDVVAARVFESMVYSGVVDPRYKDAVTTFLKQVYAAGYIEGMSHYSKKSPVAQLNDMGEIVNVFNSTKHAERITGIAYRNISKVANGDRSRSGGYSWRHLTDKEKEKWELLGKL